MVNYNFNVVVKDQSGTAVVGATVVMYNSAGTTIFTDTTIAGGVLVAAQVVADTLNPKELVVSKTGYQEQTFYIQVDLEELTYYCLLPSYSTTYCTVAQVRQYMQLNSQVYTATKTVSDSIVADRINEAEAYIDNYCRRAWRSTTVTEYFDCFMRDRNDELFAPCTLTYPDMYALATGSSDNLSNWNGSSWVDYLTTYTSGRDHEYWEDNVNGIVYLKPQSYGSRRVKIKYRYGNASVPTDIRQAAIMLVTANLLLFDANTSNIPEGYTPSISFSSKSETLKKEATHILDNHKNVYHTRI